MLEYDVHRFNRLNTVQLGKGEGITKPIMKLVFCSHDFKMIDLESARTDLEGWSEETTESNPYGN